MSPRVWAKVTGRVRWRNLGVGGKMMGGVLDMLTLRCLLDVQVETTSRHLEGTGVINLG